MDDPRDYFISYHRADQQWAEWIAVELEKAGFTTILQAWDFAPGTNWVLAMDQAAQRSRQTIAVLSTDFLQSGFTAAEWAAAIAQDPTVKGLREQR